VGMGLPATDRAWGSPPETGHGCDLSALLWRHLRGVVPWSAVGLCIALLPPLRGQGRETSVFFFRLGTLQCSFNHQHTAAILLPMSGVQCLWQCLTYHVT